MRQVLPGDTAAQKLDVVRKALGEASIREKEEDSDDDGILMPLNIDDRKDVWDCETILSVFLGAVFSAILLIRNRSDVQQFRKSPPAHQSQTNETGPKNQA